MKLIIPESVYDKFPVKKHIEGFGKEIAKVHKHCEIFAERFTVNSVQDLFDYEKAKAKFLSIFKNAYKKSQMKATLTDAAKKKAIKAKAVCNRHFRTVYPMLPKVVLSRRFFAPQQHHYRAK